MTPFLPAAAAILALAVPAPVPPPSSAWTGVAMLAQAAPSPSPSPSPAATRPAIVVPSGPLTVGQRVTVTLRGWPVGPVHLTVCGNDARRGALDCANEQATTVQAPAGTGMAPILLAAPPVACPCVLRAADLSGAAQVTAALPLSGVTAAPAPAPAAAPRLHLDELRVAGRGPLRAWFGLPETLTVRVALRNPGPADVVDPPFTLLFGRPGRAHTIVAAPPLGTIGAGQARTYEIPVPVDVAVLGKHELHGRVDVPEQPVAFVVETRRYPWGLLGAAAVLVVAPIVLRPRPPRRRGRHRTAEGTG
ncbi:hypothetical protein AB0K27_26515 [Micromonospora echinospora]|uniref:hypothetical protein n=1 Tax=Micromonospora echinospora TaxID=1877 RepID=UPI0034207212